MTYRCPLCGDAGWEDGTECRKVMAARLAGTLPAERNDVMSWGRSFSAVKKADVVETLRSADFHIGEYAHDEMLEQLEAARVAAFSLIASGALGSEEDAMFQININGHGNPEHKKSETGYANDFINVSVTRYYEQ